MKHDHLLLLPGQPVEGCLEDLTVLPGNVRRVYGQALPLLGFQVLLFSLLPQLHEGEVLCNGQNPGKRLSLGLILGRLFPDPDKGVLGHILGIVAVFQIGEGQSVYRRPGAVVECCQGIPVPGGQTGHQPFQNLRLEFLTGLSCHCNQ